MLRVLLLGLVGAFALIACSPGRVQVESRVDTAPVDGGEPAGTVEAAAVITPGHPRFLNSFANW